MGLQRVRQNWAAKHIEDVIKDTDEEPDEELQRARSGRVLSTGAAVLLEWGRGHPLGWTDSAAQNLPKPHTSGIFMETSSHRHDLSVTHSAAPPLSLEDGRQGWKFQVSNYSLVFLLISPLAVVVKNLLANAGDIRDACSIPWLGRSPGGGHGHPLQYSCLENPTDRGAWQATVHEVAKSRTRLSN